MIKLLSKKAASKVAAIAAVGVMAAMPVQAAVPAGYYDSLEGLSGVALKQAVKALADGHIAIHYGEPDPNNTFSPSYVGTWTVFPESDSRVINGADCWWDMYSLNNIRVDNGHGGLNIEHAVPNSWWGKVKNDAYKDIFHLNPSNAEANGKKSNNPLGTVANKSWTNGVTTIGTPVSGQGGGASAVFEPADAYKGDFARAYFYIFATYDDIAWEDKYAWMYDVTSGLTLQPWATELLLQWSAADPVSYKEMDRNEVIFGYQENRNPFIDCPQLAEHIWGSKQGEPFHYTLYTPAGDDPNYPGWDEEPIEMREGQWQPVTTPAEISTEYTYLLIAPNENRMMATSPVENNRAMEVCLTSPVKGLETYPDIVTAIPVDGALIRLEAKGDAWVMGVYDTDGNRKGYLCATSTSNNYANLSADSSKEGCKVTIDAQANKTVITFPYNGYQFMYNEQNSRFSAYKGTQKAIQLYRPTDEELSDPEDPEQAGVGQTGLDENAPETIIAIYDINGRRINATTTLGLEKGIYIVVSNFGARKIKK